MLTHISIVNSTFVVVLAEYHFILILQYSFTYWETIVLFPVWDYHI